MNEFALIPGRGGRGTASSAATMWAAGTTVRTGGTWCPPPGESRRVPTGRTGGSHTIKAAEVASPRAGAWVRVNPTSVGIVTAVHPTQAVPSHCGPVGVPVA